MMTPSPMATRMADVSPNQLCEHDTRWLDRAIKLAQQAAAIGEVPVGAVVYATSTGKFLGEGANRREIDADPAAHAEVLAIRAAANAQGDWRLNDATLIVTLEPCSMCAGLIVNARVGRVVFAAFDPKAGACGSVLEVLTQSKLNHQPIVIGPSASNASELRTAECAEMLRAFFRSLRTPSVGENPSA